MVLEKLTGPIKEFGLFAGLYYGLDRALMLARSPFRLYFYELMAQPIGRTDRVPAGLKKGLEVRQIARGDVELGSMPVTEDVLAWRFKQRTVCLGAFQKGRFVAYMWLCFGPYEEDEVRCRFVPIPEEESVWDFDFYVFPADRFGLGFASLWDAANEFLRNRGVRFSFSRVSRFNLASRRTHQHFGWKRLGRAFFLKAKQFQLMVATISPYVHIAMNNSSRPTFQLRA
jgi:hypothetical protein